jgi:hypothetical protein
MSDAALREVLRSPLDDLPPPRRGWWAGAAALALTAAAGFGASFGVLALTGEGGSPADGTATTAAVTTTTAPGPVSVDGLNIEVLTAFRQNGSLFVVVATTVPTGADATEVAELPGAHWVLRLPGGDLLVAETELAGPAVPGSFTVRFPDADLSAGAELLAYPAVEVVEQAFPISLGSAQLPWEGTLPGAPFRLGDQALAVDAIRLDDAGGEFTWHLEGPGEARAEVDLGATYTELAGSLQAIVSEARLPYGSLWAAAAALPSARSGGLHLFHLDDAVNPSFRSRFWGDAERVVPVVDFEVELTVRLYRYAADPVVLVVDPAAAPD